MTKFRVLTVLVAMALPLGVAYAGFRETIEVELLTDDSGVVHGASGNLADAFNSADDNQYIGCGQTGTFAFCQAQDATAPPSASNTAFCTTTNPDLIARIRAIGPDSFVSFGLNVDTGECVVLHVSTQSFYRPKATQRDKDKVKGEGREH